jgi:hypothetical protein
MSSTKFLCITALVLSLVFGGIVAGFLISGSQVKFNGEIHIGKPTPIFQIFQVREKPEA